MRFVSDHRTGRTHWETHMARLWMIWAFITSTWQHEAAQGLISGPFLFVHIHSIFCKSGLLGEVRNNILSKGYNKEANLVWSMKTAHHVTQSHRAVSLYQRCKGWNGRHVEAPLLSPTSASDCTGKLTRTRILGDEHAAKQLGNIHHNNYQKDPKSMLVTHKNVSRLAV